MPFAAPLLTGTLCTRLDDRLGLGTALSKRERCNSRMASQNGKTKAIAVTKPESAYQMMCFMPMRFDSMNMKGTAANAVTSRSNDSTKSTSVPNQEAK